MMKPPEEIYPKKKAPQFDVLGKPHSHLFYTGFPIYYQIMHDTHANLIKLNEFEDHMIAKGILRAPDEARVDLTDSQWITFETFKSRVLELKVGNKRLVHCIYDSLY